MSRDRELQKLVDRAADQRREDAELAAKREQEAHVALHEELRAAKDLTLKRPRSVFLRMTGFGIGIGWWLALATLAIAAPVIKDAWFRYVLLAFAIAFVARVIVFVRRLRIDYRTFLEFPRGLPFSVSGGADLVENELHKDHHDWQGSATVRVALLPGADDAVVEAILDLFVRRANDQFYFAGRPIGGASTDPRVKWKRDKHEVSGSANLFVLREIYRLIYKLVWLHQKQGGIANVSFSRSGGIYDIPYSKT